MSALNKGEVVAMLVDRYGGKAEYFTADFFGNPTPFPRGPFLLSRLTEVPIVVGFVVREKGGYKGIMEGPFWVKDEKDEYEALVCVVKVLETYIAWYADQWYNFVTI
jgi:lauroyl/myristoyl acyltransferase